MPEDFAHRFGAAIAERRKARELTQEELAARLEVSSEWVSRMERGAGLPSLELLERVARQLSARPSELLAAAEDPTSGRASVQRLALVAADLDEADVQVLLVTADALRARRS